MLASVSRHLSLDGEVKCRWNDSSYQPKEIFLIILMKYIISKWVGEDFVRGVTQIMWAAEHTSHLFSRVANQIWIHLRFQWSKGLCTPTQWSSTNETAWCVPVWLHICMLAELLFTDSPSWICVGAHKQDSAFRQAHANNVNRCQCLWFCISPASGF